MDLAVLFGRVGITDPELQSAALEGLLIALGLVLAGLVVGLFIWRSRVGLRRSQQRQRLHHSTALLLAIREEARGLWHDLDSGGPLGEVEARLIDKIEEGRWTQPVFTPFIGRAAGSFLVDTLVADLSALPRPLLEPTIRFYRQRAVVAQMAEDLGTERFATLPGDGKIGVVQSYFAAQRTLRTTASELNAQIEDALRLKKGERDRRLPVQAPVQVRTDGPPPLPISNGTRAHAPSGHTTN